MVDLKPDQIDSFAAELRHESYADAALIREAFATGRSANVSQIDSVWKFDLFPLRNDAYSRTELGRRTMRAIRPDGREGKQSEAIECSLASVEDTVLRKLERYRAGVEASERQWNDLRGVVHAAAGQIDADYLRRWAVYLQVEDLLSKLLAEDR